MEKYGVCQSELPASDQQIKEIIRLAKEKKVVYSMPKNAQEADLTLEKLASK